MALLDARNLQLRQLLMHQPLPQLQQQIPPQHLQIANLLQAQAQAQATDRAQAETAALRLELAATSGYLECLCRLFSQKMFGCFILAAVVGFVILVARHGPGSAHFQLSLAGRELFVFSPSFSAAAAPCSSDVPPNAATSPFEPAVSACFCHADAEEPYGELVGAEIRVFRDCLVAPFDKVEKPTLGAGNLMSCSQQDSAVHSLSGEEACLYGATVARSLLPVGRSVVICADVQC